MELASCPKVELGPGEFQLLDTAASVLLTAHNKTLAAHQFWLLEGGTLVVCQPDLGLDPRAPAVDEKFDPVMGYVTVGCLGVSLVCLVVHLIVTLIAPELHNLSGKNLFSLSLALIGFYSTFMLNMFIVEISAVSCLILAVGMYYFLLAALCWMLIIGLDVARTLKLATTQLRLSAGPQWCKFLLYSGVGWLLPALATAAATTIDLMEFPEVPDSLLIYFIVPFCIIMFLNLVFFLMSGYFVWETSRSTAKITTSGPKTNFYLYARLSTLMGLTWITGIVAGALDIDYIWYVFLVLNTLQGLFILVFFSCSKKVMSSSSTPS